MNPSVKKQILRLIAAISALATVSLIVCAARPWVEELRGYLSLVVFTCWGMTPYAYYFVSASLHSERRVISHMRLAVALIICFCGVVLIFQALFMHPDAQGGLVFLALPIYQWLALGVFELVFLLIRLMIGPSGIE